MKTKLLIAFILLAWYTVFGASPSFQQVTNAHTAMLTNGATPGALLTFTNNADWTRNLKWTGSQLELTNSSGSQYSVIKTNGDAYFSGSVYLGPSQVAITTSGSELYTLNNIKFGSTMIYPVNEAGTRTLGSATARWANIYAYNTVYSSNFNASGLVTATNGSRFEGDSIWVTTGGPTNVIVGTNGSVTLAGGGSGTLGLRVNGNTLLVTNDNVGVGGDPVAGYKLAVGGSIRASGQVLAGTYNQGRYLLFSVGGSGYLQGDNDRIYNTTSGTFMLTDGTGTNLSSVLAKNGTYSGLVTATNGVFGSFGTMALTTNMAVVINTTTQAFTGFNYVVSTGSIANNGTGFTNAIAGYYRIRVGASYLSSDAANTIGKVYTNGVICNLVSFHRGFTAATTVYGNANSENTVYLPANCYTQFAIGADANETLTFAHADFSMSPAN